MSGIIGLIAWAGFILAFPITYFIAIAWADRHPRRRM
jgi:hypothetical protein